MGRLSQSEKVLWGILGYYLIFENKKEAIDFAKNNHIPISSVFSIVPRSLTQKMSHRGN